jgi:hypothetical protein
MSQTEQPSSLGRTTTTNNNQQQQQQHAAAKAETLNVF